MDCETGEDRTVLAIRAEHITFPFFYFLLPFPVMGFIRHSHCKFLPTVLQSYSDVTYAIAELWDYIWFRRAILSGSCIYLIQILPDILHFTHLGSLPDGNRFHLHSPRLAACVLQLSHLAVSILLTSSDL